MKMNRGNTDGRFFPKVKDDHPESSLFSDNPNSSSSNFGMIGDCKTINKKEKEVGGGIDNNSWDRHDTTTSFSPNQVDSSWQPEFFPDQKSCEENENQNKEENTNKERRNSATFSPDQSSTSWDLSLNLHDDDDDDDEVEVEVEISQFVNLLGKSQSSERMKALLLKIIKSNKCEELKTSLLCKNNSNSLSEFDSNRSEIHEIDNSIDDIDIDDDIDGTDTDTETNNDKNKKQSDHRTVINNMADRSETNTPRQSGRRSGLTRQRSERISSRRSSASDATTANRRSGLGRQRRSTQSVRNLKSETSPSTGGHKSCSELDIDENYNDDDGGDDNNNRNPRLSSSTKNRRSDLSRRSSNTDVTNPTKHRRSGLSRQRRSSESVRNLKSETSPSTDGHKSLSEPFFVGEDNNNNDDDGNNNNNNPRLSSSTKNRRGNLSKQRHSSQSVRNLKSETSTSAYGHKSCGELNIDEHNNNNDDDDNNNNNSSSSFHRVVKRERTDELHDLLDNMRLATLAGPSSVKIEEGKEEQPPVEKKGFRNLLVRHLSKKIVTSSSKGSYLKDTSSNSSDEDDCWEVAVKS
jgi:hypothetical protein